MIAKVEKQQKESKINPVCDIAEKANKRFNFFWYKAAKFPISTEKKPQKIQILVQKE